MVQLNIHLLSDSTGETLENVAKAAIAQFDGVEPVKHFWPMVRNPEHLGRVMEDVQKHPGLVLFTISNPALRERLEKNCNQLGLPYVAILDSTVHALSGLLGQEANVRPGRQHVLDTAYFSRVEAIQFTIAHDDGVGAEDWEEADIILAGVSRTSKTPTSIYLANRGLKTANVPIVPESPPSPALFRLRHPLVVGLTTRSERLIQVRRNRLLSLAQTPDTDYVDVDKVNKEVAFARRMFADNGWPVIDVTRRSIEESAAAVLNFYRERQSAAGSVDRSTDL